jgi:TPR repeat protein
MWRRILSRLGFKDTRHAVEQSLNSSEATASNLTSNDFINKAMASKGTSAQKLEAHAALRDAVRELSEGTASTMTLPPDEVIQKWDQEDPSVLNGDELNSLARAHFEGINGVYVDLRKAVELWKLAAEKGSLGAYYSLAVCYRDGKGIEKDATTAFSMLKTLAEKNNFNSAHVSNVHAVCCIERFLFCTIEKARGLMLTCLPHCMSTLYLITQYAIAIMLLNGEGVEKDEAAAFKHFKVSVLIVGDV